MGYKQSLLKHSRLTEIELLKLMRAALFSVQQDLVDTDGKSFHLLEGTVKLQEDGKYIFTPSKFLADLITKRQYPEVLKIEEMKLLKWIVALMEGGDE